MQADSEIKQFIAWQDAYDAEVSLLNEQHKGVLFFINAWYEEIKAEKTTALMADRAREKLDYLTGFAKGHLRFESEMLKRLTEEYGYPRDEYREHMRTHRRFVETLLLPMIKEVKIESGTDSTVVRESIIHEGLFDVARWWFEHIRALEGGEAPGPDHLYRIFLKKMSDRDKLELLNGMVVFIALEDNVFWLRAISNQPPAES